MNQEFAQAMQRFIQHIQQCYPTSSTATHYQSDLEQFGRMVDKAPRAVTRADVSHFVTVQLAQGLSAATVNRRLATLSSFFEFLADEANDDYWANPVVWRSHRVHQGRHLPRDLSEAVARPFWQAVRLGPVRDQAIVALMLDVGLRVSEVATLRVQDFEPAPYPGEQCPEFTEGLPSLRVRGKGAKERRVWLAPETAALVQSWLAERPAVVDVYVAIPSNRDNQLISNLSFSAPYDLLTDRYGQPIAYFQFGILSPDQQVTVSWEGDVEIEAMDYGVDPSQVGDLNQIPSDIVSTYTTNESMYCLESQVIQDAAQEAANGATNPYWMARNTHDFVANRLTYLNDHQWDDAETVYLQQHGSCSEYTTLFIALCRANGLPARYVGGTRHRQEGTYVDTVFHRWAEVYLPPYGWIPVDVTHDDTDGTPVHTYFGALTDERFVTTVGGGDSEYLGWNYHYAYRYYWSGSRPNRTRERSFTWEPYPPELRVSPSSLTGLELPKPTTSVIGNLDITSTNGSYGWLLDYATSWLQLNRSSGTTPDTLQVIADTTGLDLGLHTGEIVLKSHSLDGDVSVPVEVRVVEGVKVYLPVVRK